MFRFYETNLPKSILRLVEHGVAKLDPSRVILYGSRARGDAGRYSDYDLAFEFAPGKKREWLSFQLDSRMLPITLRKTDLLALQEASSELAQRVKTEGIVLYERQG